MSNFILRRAQIVRLRQIRLRPLGSGDKLFWALLNIKLDMPPSLGTALGGRVEPVWSQQFWETPETYARGTVRDWLILQLCTRFYDGLGPHGEPSCERRMVPTLPQARDHEF